MEKIIPEKSKNINGKKRLVLAGAGLVGAHWLKRLQSEDIEVLYFVDKDKNKIGRELCGKRIICYDELNEIPDDTYIFITVASDKAKEEIEALLSRMGFRSRIWQNSLFINDKISAQGHIYNSYLEGNNLLLEDAELVDSYLGQCSYLSYGACIVNTKVGKYTCIGPEVRIILGQHPTSGIVSVHPAFYSTKNAIGYSYINEDKFVENRYANQEYAVVIENDVWIGMGAKIMEGVTIADGSIIAAGAVVVKNTKPFEIVGGVPAHHIKYRFEKNEREKLLEIQWWNKDSEWIQKHAEEFDDVKSFCKMNTKI